MIRIGFGYDSHRFDKKRSLILAGVHIPESLGLRGHSDGDAVLHALIDAMLGAAGLGDIGEQFPDDDPQLAGIDSATLLRRAMAKISLKKYRVVNCDITIITEKPKLSPFKSAMRQNIATLLKLPVDAVSVKAKTNEEMDAVGRGEGLVAMAVVLLGPEASTPQSGKAP